MRRLDLSNGTQMKLIKAKQNKTQEGRENKKPWLNRTGNNRERSPKSDSWRITRWVEATISSKWLKSNQGEPDLRSVRKRKTLPQHFKGKKRRAVEQGAQPWRDSLPKTGTSPLPTHPSACGEHFFRFSGSKILPASATQTHFGSQTRFLVLIKIFGSALKHLGQLGARFCLYFSSVLHQQWLPLYDKLDH